MIHATPDWPLFSRSAAARQEHYDGVTENAEAVMNRETNWLRNEFGVHARTEVHRGQASRTIVRAVEAYQPDLLIIGASGEHASQIAPAALGGTTLKLISQVNRPLLLVRNPTPTPYNNSLAAVKEAGELSRRIVHCGSALVRAGTCEVVCAYEVPYIERLRLCDLSNATLAACSEDQEKSVQNAIGALLCAGEATTQIHAHVIRGAALPIILTEITRHGSQVLIVGRHEHHPDGAVHALMGSVAVRLAYHAPCDVLMVP
jgi:nucleotide-binding universal stress UspA family protein